MSRAKVFASLQAWIEARRKYRLSDAHVQMARELGMNPKRLGGVANHHQEPWKRPLPEFIEMLYERRFGRRRPERVVALEDRVTELTTKKAARHAQRAATRVQGTPRPNDPARGDARTSRRDGRTTA